MSAEVQASGVGIPDPALAAAERAELVSSVVSGLAGSLHLRRTALRFLELITGRLADWAMVALVDGDTERGVDLYGGEPSGAVARLTAPMRSDVGLGRVIASGQTELLHVTDDSAEASGLEAMVPEPLRRAEAARLRPVDVLGVPLSARGLNVGALVLVRAAGQGFDAADIEVIREIAQHAATAFDTAILFQERSALAGVLQQSLKMSELPQVDGVRVAGRLRSAAEHLDIGGDFYDVHGGDDDWLMVLGDVCGKGAEAAVLTGLARQSIRTAAYFDRRPSRVLAALNSVLYDTGAERFITLACLRLLPATEADGTSRRLEVAVAGHPPPLIVRADHTVEQVQATGIVAGVVPEHAYSDTVVTLHRGDLMVLFTDGILEARSGVDFYGLERLTALLPAYATAGPDVLCDAIERDVVEYLGGGPHDDMALLALRCGDE